MADSADLELARRVAAGEDLAAEELVRSLSGALYGYARRMLGDEVEAEDALQEALLAILDAAGRYDGRVSLRAWAFSILRHKITDRLRRRSRDPVTTVADPEEAFFHGSGHWKNDVTFASWDENSEVVAVVLDCLGKLPYAQREALNLVAVRGLHNQEAAEILEVTPVNLRKILHRGRQAVRRCADAKLGAAE